MTEAILGADVGGTSSKVVVMTTDGRVLGTGKSDGGNIRSSKGDALGNVFAAVEQALEAADRSTPDVQVVAAHIGIAGAGPAKFAEVEARCKQRWIELGLDADRLHVSSDLEVAFAGADHGGTGLIVLSGTGAVSAAFKDYVLVGRCDGMGWLLGDQGSSTWIGLRGIQAAAEALDFRGPDTELKTVVLQELRELEAAGAGSGPGEDAGAGEDVAPRDPRQELIALVYPLAPSSYGRVSQAVFDCAARGDVVSQEILDGAVVGLVQATKGAIEDARASAGADVPAADFANAIVFAGAMLRPGGPLTDQVREALVTDVPGVGDQSIYEPGPPIAGALFLAARQAGAPSLAQIHDGLVGGDVSF